MGVKDSGCPLIGGASLLLVFSHKEKEQSKKTFAELSIQRNP
jgi:hypothetical protein